MAPEFGVGSTNCSLQTCLGKFWMVIGISSITDVRLYRLVSVARASFALPRSHRGEVRLTVGANESSRDSH